MICRKLVRINVDVHQGVGCSCLTVIGLPGGGGTLPMFGYMGAAEGLKS